MLSVCIVNWNTRDYLRECLASLAAYPPDNETIEVVVVDNASSDGSAAMVATEFPDVRLIAESANLGYAEGNNRALEAATGDNLLLLNPDVLLNRWTLTSALGFLRARADAGAVGIRQLDVRGATQHSVRGFPTPESLLTEVLGLSRIFPRSRRFGAYRMTYFDYDREARVDQPMGTFLLFPRAVYEKVGGLDPRFPIFFNDVDWCYRVKQQGWEIYYTPTSSITHYGGAATGQAPKPRMIHESHESLIKFFEKHYAKNRPAWTLSALFRLIRLGAVARSSVSRLRGTK